jgi:hypothetical protein
MKWLCASMLIAAAGAQDVPPRFEKDPAPLRLPNGKLQSEEVLKEEHQRTLREAEEMKQLVGELHAELEKNDRYVVSIQLLKKIDDIEKRLKRIRGRLTRF